MPLGGVDRYGRTRSIFTEALAEPDRRGAGGVSRPGLCGESLTCGGGSKRCCTRTSDAGSFLESPPPEPGRPPSDQPVTERPGTVIGPYKLLQQIGEGGMGTVYMAEQTAARAAQGRPQGHQAGMDSGQVIARFEAERQALAMMDHVNIARVLDAGATETGRPYFVMELVHGVPITKYCDDNHLTPRQRLELFVPVCQAIQHAHQKGIIHRDIKPSNVHGHALRRQAGAQGDRLRRGQGDRAAS